MMVPVGAEKAPASASDGMSLSCDIVETLCFCVSARQDQKESRVLRMEAQRGSPLFNCF